MVCRLALAGNLTYVDKIWNLNNNRLALIHDGSNLDFPAFFRYSLETLLPRYRNIGHSGYLRVGLGVSNVSRRRRRIIAVPGDEERLVRPYGDMAIWLANLGLVWVFLPAAVALLTGLTLIRRYADPAMVWQL